MPGLSNDDIRHALSVARSSRFAEVEVEVGETKFRARLKPGKPKAPRASAVDSAIIQAEAGPLLKAIKAPLVGYFRDGTGLFAEGKKVKPGDVVGIVSALGIANDIEANAAGEITEVLVKEGDPVEYGQVLAYIKED